MDKYHNILEIRFNNKNLSLKVDGKDYTFELSKISPRLYAATQIERETYNISPSGYGIHWSLIDEDLSIDGLLGIPHSQNYTRKIAV